MILYVSMVFHYPSYQIRYHNSHLGFGGHSKKGWVPRRSQVECTIQTLEDMLRYCIIHFKVHWDKNFPLVEFSYNNSYHSSTVMDPYEAL